MSANRPAPAVASVPTMKSAAITPILLDSPSVSTRRVSFNTKPQINKISYNNGIPEQKSKPTFEVKDKTLLLSGFSKDDIKKKAHHHLSMVFHKKQIILKYRRKVDLNADLKALGLKSNTYMENKILVAGIGYKETEETVARYFGKFGEVEKVVLEKNKKDFCTGKATITFATDISNSNVEFRMNNRLLRVDRIKKQYVNSTRLHISHMEKQINISRMRSILKNAGFVPKNIRIDRIKNKNKGYGFVEFCSSEEAQRFMDSFGTVQPNLGPRSQIEFSNEKKAFVS